MSLGAALSNALSGLKYTSTATNVVSNNISNASNPNYVKRRISSEEIVNATTMSGVRAANVERVVDNFVQSQLRSQGASASYSETVSTFLSRLDTLYGQPGSETALDTQFSKFSAAAQSLATSPESATARSSLLAQAGQLSQTLNGLSGDVQALRTDAEAGIADAVTQLNTALDSLFKVNAQIFGSRPGDADRPALLDQRDSYLDTLSDLVGARVVIQDDQTAQVYLPNGTSLMPDGPGTLEYSPAGQMTPSAQYNVDPAKRGTSTVFLRSSAGKVDLIANNGLVAGRLGALINVRDRTLVAAQSRLDEVAAGLISAVGDKAIASSTITGGRAIDTSALLSGNKVSLSVNDGGTAKTYTFVNLADPSVSIPSTFTPDPNDTVIGINFADTPANVKAALQAAVGSNFTADFSAGVFSITAASGSSVSALSAKATQSALQGGSAEFPLFSDAANVTVPFSDDITVAGGVRRVGISARIIVNPLVAGDSSQLVSYSATTQNGDNTRPSMIYNQVASAAYTFGAPGQGTTNYTKFTGTLKQFANFVMSTQASEATTAKQTADAQGVVVKSLQQRLESGSGVSIDEEMTNLVNLQNTYSANARVMSAVREMYNSLLQIVQ